MNSRILFCLIISSIWITPFCSGVDVKQGNNDKDTTTPIQQLASAFIFTEGPASDSEGNIYFTDPYLS